LFEDFFERMDNYAATRDFPAVKGPSYLGVHLRFGTLSLRKLAATAHQMTITGSQGAAVWLSELIWRDFYAQILHHHPHVVAGSFKREYDAIQWESGPHAEACSPPGARAVRATRWWMRPWPRSTKRAICTTACAWWWRASW
jgi:deoxyribodipyrimidine photo-lyase